MSAQPANIVPLAGTARESFFAAQARYRASARRWVVAMTVVVLAITLVVSLLLAPITFALFGLAIDLVNLARPMPDVLGAVGRLIDAVANSRQPLPAPRIMELSVLAALPGFAVLLVIWGRLGRILSRLRFDAMRAALGLRDPRPGDLEEQQLGNIVQEMTIAAERPPPRLQLLDSDACNLGLWGDGNRAVLVVTRGLLDRLDRAQTQALIGQAVAALGNGDGLLAARMLHLDMMTGLLMLLAQAPIDKAARKALRPVLRVRAGAGDLDAVRNVLVGSTTTSSDSGDSPDPDSGGDWRDWLRMPFMGSMLIGILIVPISVMLFVAPLNGMIWRRRRLLGDAMAVQFTRDPQALGEAYAALSEAPTKLDLRMRCLGDMFLLDAGGASHLSLGVPYPRYATRIARLDAMGAAVEEPGRHQRASLWLWVVGLPIALVLAGMLGLVIVMGAWLSLALNGLFLALPTGLIHLALRALGH